MKLTITPITPDISQSARVRLPAGKMRLSMRSMRLRSITTQPSTKLSVATLTRGLASITTPSRISSALATTRNVFAWPFATCSPRTSCDRPQMMIKIARSVIKTVRVTAGIASDTPPKIINDRLMIIITHHAPISCLLSCSIIHASLSF